jgi:hypothetical protein
MIVMPSVRRFFSRAVATAAVASLAISGAASTASAWTIDPGRVTSYANAYWNTFNPAFPAFANDCTNFTSQVLYYGGLPFQGTPTGSGAHNITNQWWANSGSWTYSWSVAESLRQYLMNYRGFYPTYSHYGAGSSNAPSGSRVGAVVFYNWGDDPSRPAPYAQHATIVTYLNTRDPDPKHGGSVGTLVNAHTGNHAQAIWHLQPYNSLYATTTVAMYRW